MSTHENKRVKLLLDVSNGGRSLLCVSRANINCSDRIIERPTEASEDILQNHKSHGCQATILCKLLLLDYEPGIWFATF